MHKVEKGFTLMQGLLVILTIALVFLAGWYVVDSNSTDNAKNTSKPAQTINTKPANKIEVPPGTYQTTQLPFTFSYPTTWTTKADEESNYYSVLVEAADTKLETGVAYPAVTSGAQIRVSKMIGSAVKTLTEYKQGIIVTEHGTNKKDISVDGREGLVFDLAYEGPATHHVIFFDKGIEYGVTIQQTVYAKDEYAKAFENLVASIKFQ